MEIWGAGGLCTLFCSDLLCPASGRILDACGGSGGMTIRKGSRGSRRANQERGKSSAESSQ